MSKQELIRGMLDDIGIEGLDPADLLELDPMIRELDEHEQIEVHLRAYGVDV